MIIKYDSLSSLCVPPGDRVERRFYAKSCFWWWLRAISALCTSHRLMLQRRHGLRLRRNQSAAARLRLHQLFRLLDLLKTHSAFQFLDRFFTYVEGFFTFFELFVFPDEFDSQLVLDQFEYPNHHPHCHLGLRLLCRTFLQLVQVLPVVGLFLLLVCQTSLLSL